MGRNSDILANAAQPKKHIFHDRVTTADVPNGNVFTNSEGRSSMKFGIGGTSTAQSYQFRGVDEVGNDNLVMCVRGSDFSTASSTTAKGETWEAPINGLVSFYVKIISVSGGYSEVKGQATM